MKQSLPEWDLSFIFPSVDSPEVDSKLSELREQVESIKIFIEKNLSDGHKLQLKQLAKLIDDETHLVWQIWNIRAFFRLHLSVDSSNKIAKKSASETLTLNEEFLIATKPIEAYILSMSESEFLKLLTMEEMKGKEFHYSQLRKKAPYQLTLPEEKLLLKFRKEGLEQWNELYSDTTSKLKVHVEGFKESLGFAKAQASRYHPDKNVRKNVAHGIEDALSPRLDSLALALNNISSWKVKENKLRTRNSGEDLFQRSCVEERVQAVSIETMLSEIEAFLPRVRSAASLVAKSLGQKKLNYWDLTAPFPLKENTQKTQFSYENAFSLIRESLIKVHPEFSKFLDKMENEKLISASLLPKKRAGAFCSRFENPKKPVVFMSYTDGIKSVLTLAHELGHAYHNWVLSDVSFLESRYKKCVAETASIFFETIIQESLLSIANSQEEKLALLWEQYSSAEIFTMSIPSVFHAEKELYSRVGNEYLGKEDLSELFLRKHQEVYGDILHEHSKLRWASTLHLYIPNMSYYNFPYSFGYLFSLGVYSQREKMGDKFYENYKSLLLDTGRMSVEDLAQKHLNVDIHKPEFWRDSLSVVGKQLDQFELQMNLILN